MHVYINTMTYLSLEFKCQEGYTKKFGRMGGLDSKNQPRGQPDMSPVECRKQCEENHDCRSFAYSEESNWCKLQNKLLPPKKGQYQDFVWCSKGEQFSTISHFY